MSKVYLIKNQRNLYLSKDGLWLDAQDKQHFYRTKHQDEALNTLLEANAKDIELRLTITESTQNEKGRLEL